FYRRDFLFCMDFFIYTKYFILSMQPGPIKSKEKIKEKTFLPSIDKRNAAAIYKILTHQKQRLLAND
ncbi:hypothetical protein AS179_07005, partial [Enterococcus faecium]